MGSLYDALAQIPDYRDPRGVRYRLADLHFMIICAVLCNHLNAVEMAYYMEENLENLRSLRPTIPFPVFSSIPTGHI